jgi:hypothetical protein
MTKEELEKRSEINVKSFLFELGLVSLLIASFVVAGIKEKTLGKKIDQSQKEIRQIEATKQDSIINYQTQNQR